MTEASLETFGRFQLEALRCPARRCDLPAILLLHGINNINPAAPFLAPLADHGEIVAQPGLFRLVQELVMGDVLVQVAQPFPRKGLGEELAPPALP